MVALVINQLFKLGRGYEWIDGCTAVFEDSDTEINIRISEGRVRNDGNEISVEEQTITLQEGDPNYDRRDLIWIDRHGDAHISPGEARETVPSGAERQSPWSPAPPDSAGLDGVPIAEVWVPRQTEGSSELTNGEDLIDRRLGGSVYSAIIPELDEDPDPEDFRVSRMWLNTAADGGDGELRYYNSAADEIRTITDTTEQTSVSPDDFTIEEFSESSVEGNWIGGTSSWDHRSPQVVGDQAAWTHDDSFITHKYSMPGDGLSRYPESGDTIRLHVYRESGESPNWVNIGFAKEADTRAEDYRVELNWNQDTLELYKVGETIPDQDTLEVIDGFSTNSDEWYVIEIEYDGNGEGSHPFRIYDTDENDEADTVLDEKNSPESDTDYRGRGVAIRTSGTGTGIDNLVVDPE